MLGAQWAECTAHRLQGGHCGAPSGWSPAGQGGVSSIDQTVPLLVINQSQPAYKLIPPIPYLRA